MTDLTYALAQINLTVGDIAGNIAKIHEWCKKTPDTVDLLIFPELAVCGYPPEDLILRPSFLDAVQNAVDDFIEQSKPYPFGIILPCTLRENGHVYNALHLIEKGKIIGTIKKHQLPNHGVFDEMRVFKSAALQKPIKFRGQKLGIMICEDIWHEPSANYLKKHGAKILIVPNASPFTIDKIERRVETVGQRVKETGLPVLYLNHICGQDDLIFDGGSFIMDAKGTVTHRAPHYDECLLLSSDQTDLDVPSEDERIYKAMQLGLRDYVRKNGFSKVVLGLSGGVDSALVATVAADTLGAENVKTVMLPSPFTSQDSIDDAQQLAKNLGTDFESIPIEPTLTQCEDDLKAYIDIDATGITHQNLQSRLRGTILMAISNATGAIVLATGNKSEMAVGYATLYGDMNGAYNILKDVYKTTVYRLCQWRNRQSNVIPERILTKAPTAELKHDQTDQDSLPPYDMLDKILNGLIEEDKSPAKLAEEGMDFETAQTVWHMVLRSEYKRQQAPPGPKISKHAFDRQRRYPITSGFR